MTDTSAIDQGAMYEYLKKIATGPELSQDLTREEAHHGMQLILEQRVNPVQAAIFLVALRMKRETEEENYGLLEALREATNRILAQVNELVEMADPYDGFKRYLPVSPFLPAVLAACGVPSILHGVSRMGPKFGVTHHQVLQTAGVAVDLTPTQAAVRIEDSNIGWAYVDQQRYCPSLYALAELRTLMVKRSCLATLEKLIGPIGAQGRNHLVVGYVHKSYPRLLTLLARHAGYQSALILRGVEGGIIPTLRSTAPGLAYWEEGQDETLFLDPQQAGVHSETQGAPLPKDRGEFQVDSAAQAAAESGLAALGGKPGVSFNSLVYGAALVLWHLRRFATLEEAAAVARGALSSGLALSCFQGE